MACKKIARLQPKQAITHATVVEMRKVLVGDAKPRRASSGSLEQMHAGFDINNTL